MMDPATAGRSGAVHDESDEDASEAQAQVIASLRAQVTDLFSQVTQLNSKLVASYDRVSDLEDQLHDTSASLRNASVSISSLELERSHHLAALNTGLLVEKAHVTAELNRLMERATEEAAQRGQAESARHDIEKDLDDLSASLFDQANTMVAEARFSQAISERKVQDAEQALRIAEDAVKDMQVQMQVFQAEKEAAELEAREAKLTMGKGKWIECDDSRVGEVPRIRFVTTHPPYAEFITFIVHLRTLRASQPAPPVISALLNQPFIARLLNEDSEPTVRLDLAPSLNWLSRRSVLAAIHTGMLTVEPVPFSSLVQELHQHPQSISTSSLSCALCGTFIARLPSTSPVSRTHSTNGSSWFKYPLALGSTQSHNTGTPRLAESEPPGQVYIFRLTSATTSVPPPAIAPTHASSMSVTVAGTSRPALNPISSARVMQSQTHNSPYPLCTSNYCLARLRSTCSLWAFVRVGIVERVWEEEVVQPSKSLGVNGDTTHETPSSTTAACTGAQFTNGVASPPVPDKPPVPPRRRRLWDMLGGGAASWGKESGENAKEKDAVKRIPPPPSHPSAPHPHSESLVSQVDVQEPPPLPKRNVVRSTHMASTVISPSDTQSGVAVPENKESAHPSGPADPDEHVSDSPSMSVGEITFAAPPSEVSPSPLTASHPVTSTGESAPLTQDHPPLSSPHTIPLPVTPTTPNPIAHLASSDARPRSRLSSPITPPPSSRPASPAISPLRTGSPAPTVIARAASPSRGHAPPSSTSPMRGKTSVSSPLAPSSRPASPAPATGPGAPPLPRRAPARRAVPPPPISEDPKTMGEGGRQEAATLPAAPADPIPETGRSKVSGEGSKEEVASAVTPTLAAGDPIPEVDGRKSSEGETVAETKDSDAEADRGIGVKEVIVPQAASAPAPTIEAILQPARDVTVHDVQGPVNGMPATVVADPCRLPNSFNGDCSASVNTASTKQSSGTEGEGFAGDATWEERTWKELARLKEEMFWARVGGIRALQG